MNEDLAALQEKLTSCRDGGGAFDLSEGLLDRQATGEVAVTPILTSYALGGHFDHVREHITSRLADAAAEGDESLGAFFEKGLALAACRYWAASGAVRTLGVGAYPKLIALSKDAQVPLECRAMAIKCLAVHSGQRFDRDLSRDPGYWKEQDLRLQEVEDWAGLGCPKGEGYEQPSRHPALDMPKTEVERLAATLDQYLTQEREAEQDAANPANCLTPASEATLSEIQGRWNLPRVYLDFLKRFSPLRVYSLPQRDEDEALTHIELVGAEDFIRYQDRYRRLGTNWPDDLVVVATETSLGDPYAIKLGKREDAPVHYSMCDGREPEWEFSEHAPSFMSFLTKLVRLLPKRRP